MKRLCILGSTGSIGTQTLEIVRDNPADFSVTAISCRSSIEKMAQQIAEFRPQYAAVATEAQAESLRPQFPDTQILSGPEALVYIASQTECDMVVNSLVGMSGLEPTYHAISAGKTIALANKETLVAGGALVMGLAAEKGVSILPVDSEHSAVFQCLEGYDRSQVAKIILTASGGPFRGKKIADLKNVTAAQALKHPNWSMGSKITIDSSTLMNKGFEVIEARWLFDMPASGIDVIVHPESIIHSLVEYEDHAVMAQLGLPDMKVPISLALNYPKRLKNDMPALDLATCGNLTFEKPDLETFRCLKMAYDALEAGDTYCTALNAANEICVQAFLEGRIKYLDIQDTLAKIMDTHKPSKGADLDEIIRIDSAVRRETEIILKG